MKNSMTFAPGDTTTLACLGTSNTANLTATASCVRIWNAGSATAFVRFGSSSGTTTATTSDLPIPAGAIETFSKGVYDRIAGICSSGTSTTLYVTSGEGF